MTTDLGLTAAPSTTFAALLKRLREAREATVVREYNGTPRIETRVLSQNELARRAGVDPAYVHLLERGQPRSPRAERSRPSLPVVQRLADALELGCAERAALLVAAGYWPWPDLDQATCDFVLAAGVAIVDGDWRHLVGAGGVDAARDNHQRQ